MNQKTPQHVAIIMDGNGRWAEEQGLSRSDGHAAGVDVVKTIVQASIKKRIGVLSLWAFGSENWARPEQEISFLMQLFIQALARETKSLHGHGVRLRFTGDRAPLLVDLQHEMAAAEALTSHNSTLTLNVVINYGGKWDILQATQTLVRDVQAGRLSSDSIDEHAFSKRLSMSDLPNPDLFIRTSGEQRISNFFLWQLAYTELYFSELYWPDFSLDEFEKALLWFQQRQRRYGRTSQQVLETAHV